MNMTIDLTDASSKLFRDLCADAPNWNNQPLLDITKEERGNLTQLKRQGLLTTFRDEGCDWVQFTKKGAAFASQLGFTIKPTAVEGE